MWKWDYMLMLKFENVNIWSCENVNFWKRCEKMCVLNFIKAIANCWEYTVLHHQLRFVNEHDHVEKRIYDHNKMWITDHVEMWVYDCGNGAMWKCEYMNILWKCEYMPM